MSRRQEVAFLSSAGEDVCVCVCTFFLTVWKQTNVDCELFYSYEKSFFLYSERIRVIRNFIDQVNDVGTSCSKSFVLFRRLNKDLKMLAWQIL